MIEKEDIIAFMREKAYKPLTVQELEQQFQLEGAEAFRNLVKTLNELEQSGDIVRTRTNRYGVPERMNLIHGKLTAHPKGFGFVVPLDAAHPDVYIHANDMNGAMHGDTVIARVNKQQSGPKRMEGEIVRIIARNFKTVVATFHANRNFGFAVPDDKRLTADIFIPPEGVNGALDEQKVVIQLTDYPSKHKSAAGEVVEVLGQKGDPGVDILAIIRKYALPEAFPEDVEEAASRVPEQITAADCEGRRDLRERQIVTIDGRDAKDLDDAVSVEVLPNGYTRLGVHIADVSYYVTEGSALDEEAYRRGCSVYLVDRVIPMLPRRLSNGICSLNPHVDRLTLSCEMDIDAQGNVVNYDIFPSVIRSKERMTYDDVYRIVENEDTALSDRYRELVPMFQLMKQLAQTLRKKRIARGAIDFNFTEAKIVVDEEGKPQNIVPRPRTISEQIIEEFMLVANETVATHCFWLNVPFVYRIHEHPNSEKLQTFLEFVTHFGFTVRGKADDMHPRALQQLLETISGEPEESVISRVLLRSMQQARYEAHNVGHYGLAAEHYTHFTSPIRRYPDLVVHRMLRELISNDNQLPAERSGYWQEQLPDIAEQSSQRERVAVDAERETDDLKKAEYMLDKVGEEYVGVISGVTSFGLFVELENTVEGMVHVSYMVDDYYHFVNEQQLLVGERTGQQFRLGDEVHVRVSHVNLEEHTIDFELLDRKTRAKRNKKQRPTVIVGERKRNGKRNGDRNNRGEGKAGRNKNGGRAGKSKGKVRKQSDAQAANKPFYEPFTKKKKKRKRR